MNVATQAQKKNVGFKHPKEPVCMNEERTPPTCEIGNKGCGASRGYMTWAVVVYSVSYRQGMRNLIVTAITMRFGCSCGLLGVRWLVLWGYKQYTYIKLYKNDRYLLYLLEYVPHSSGYNN